MTDAEVLEWMMNYVLAKTWNPVDPQTDMMSFEFLCLTDHDEGPEVARIECPIDHDEPVRSLKDMVILARQYQQFREELPYVKPIS